MNYFLNFYTLMFSYPEGVLSLNVSKNYLYIYIYGLVCIGFLMTGNLSASFFNCIFLMSKTSA